jgi:transcriptional regulator with XRE-family HTH domain
MRLGAKLDKLRRQTRITRKELAALTEASDATVGRWLSGLAEPRRIQLCHLAAAFKVPVEFLCRDDLDEPATAGKPQSFEDQVILEIVRKIGYEVALARLAGRPANPPPNHSPPGGLERRTTPGPLAPQNGFRP